MIPDLTDDLHNDLCDLGVMAKKQQNPNELVLVTSLINKMPNLGGKVGRNRRVNFQSILAQIDIKWLQLIAYLYLLC